MQKSGASFITLISVFFFWGFVAASNGILIPLFKDKFALSQFQSQLVDLAFYASYFFGSLIYFFGSSRGVDPISRAGYKNSLITGLLISAAGSLIFLPAADQRSYPMLLCALFIIGLGFAIQQIVANPFVINFGARETGAHRLNLAGGLNSFGTMIGPVLLSYALFGNINTPDPKETDLTAVKEPALVLFGLFMLCAFILYFSKMPKIEDTAGVPAERGFPVIRLPQLWLGMIALFVYVGVEVTIQSNMGALLAMPDIKGIDHRKISHFISLYWGSLMIGRLTGSLVIFNIGTGLRKTLQFIVPFLGLGVIYLINYLRGSDVSDFDYYIPYVALFAVIYTISGDNASLNLLLLAIAGTVMMIAGLVTTGDLALYSFISGGLFCSVMWPCIFALAINGLGRYTNQASALLVMMILGGATIPPLQGLLADATNAHTSYILTIFCFMYLAWYAYRMRKATVSAAAGH